MQYDMINKAFGKLTVIARDENSSVAHLLCKCSCGNPELVSMNIDNIRRGKTKSCGQCAKFENIGKKFSLLTVIKAIDRTTFVCRCDCGNEVEVKLKELVRGHKKSCGCWRVNKSAERWVGQRIGKLVVIKPTEQRTYKQNIVYECKCDCGNTVFVDVDSLNKKEKISCGCSRKSLGELTIEKILKDNNITYEMEKSFSDLYSERKGKPRFDFFVDNKYLIEFDGKQHFEYRENAVHPIVSKENYERTIANDKIKNEYCFKNNIPLIRIPYTHLNKICLEDLLLETSNFILKSEE